RDTSVPSISNSTTCGCGRDTPRSLVGGGREDNPDRRSRYAKIAMNEATPTWSVSALPDRGRGACNEARPARSVCGPIPDSRSRGVGEALLQLAGQALQHLLCISEQHHRVVPLEELVLDTSEAGAEASLHHEDGARVEYLQHWHAIDRTGLVGLGCRIDDVVRAQH